MISLRTYFGVLVFLVWCYRQSTGEQSDEYHRIARYRYEIEKWLTEIDEDFLKFNSWASYLTWQLGLDPENGKYSDQAKQMVLARNRWRNGICGNFFKTELLTEGQNRRLFFLCRGEKYDDDEVIKNIELMGTLSLLYNSEICLPETMNFFQSYARLFVNISDIPKPGSCVTGEPDLENLMKRQDLNQDQLKWIWNFWHNSVGSKMKNPFVSLVDLQNRAARKNGYSDIGAVWREELEIPNLENVIEELYSEIEPFYKMLHAVIRHKLREKYGPQEVNLFGPIPIHLLGNMWGQDWSNLVELLVNRNNKLRLNEQLKRNDATMRKMALEAEDFYVSMGLPKMTKKFWKNSILQKSDNITACHGTAADLYNNGDFRILMCGKPDMDSFYVIHHEMGHIEYFMAYDQQPAIFRSGTNSAFHESIGDAIMHGVLAPQHLHRIGLLGDRELFDNNTEFDLILVQALEQIPQIPFALLLDKYRWRIFSGEIDFQNLNKAYWEMTEKYRGIKPPEKRNEDYFDAGAKFHVPDGTPFIRYFLSAILQIDIFKSLCEYTVLGRKAENSKEESIIPLQRCDIYGSKKAGKLYRLELAYTGQQYLSF